MNTLVFLMVFALVNATDLYLFSHKVTIIRILSVALVTYALLFYRSRTVLSQTTRRLMTWAFILIGYKFVVSYAVHSDESLQPVYDFLIEAFAVLLLPALEKLRVSGQNIVKFIVISSIPAIALGIMQVKNPAWTLENIIPANSMIFTGTASTFDYIKTTSRIAGPFNISIGFALLVGVICIILWAKYIMGGSGKVRYSGIIGFMVAHALVVFTHTRSAIYGIIPSILLTIALSGPRLGLRLLFAGTASLVLFLSLQTISEIVQDYSERSKLEMDANTYHKLAANIYSVYGVLRVNPLFGVKKPADIHDDPVQYRKDYHKQREMIKRSRRELGRLFDIKEKFAFEVYQTHHNIIGYYIRYYGLIGFTLFSVTMVMVYRKIVAKTDHTDRYMLLGVFIFLLQFSMLHNTKILAFPLLWVLLACGDEKSKEKSNGDT